MAPLPLDHQYPDPDLVAGYVKPGKPKPAKEFHAAEAAENPAETFCGRPLADLIHAGWARGLLRQGLQLCKTCAAAGALAVPEAAESPQDYPADDPGLTPPDAG